MVCFSQLLARNQPNHTALGFDSHQNVTSGPAPENNALTAHTDSGKYLTRPLPGTFSTRPLRFIIQSLEMHFGD
jgi:hypothetical protein